MDIEYWKDLEQRETDPDKKIVYKLAEELCILKKSQMEVRAGFHPESEEVLSMIQEETRTNDLTRYERFKNGLRRTSQVCRLSLSTLRGLSRQLLWLEGAQ